MARTLTVLPALVSMLVANSLQAAETPAAVAPCPPCKSCCAVESEVSPRLGVSINGDQWLVGNQLRMTLPCLGNLGYGPFLAFGFGGNHFTFRSAARLDYQIWFDAARTFAVVPAVGAAALFYVPVGGFARFCERTDLAECYGQTTGLEVGGAIRYRFVSVDAFVGLGDLPVLTLTAGVSFPLAHLGGP